MDLLKKRQMIENIKKIDEKLLQLNVLSRLDAIIHSEKVEKEKALNLLKPGRNINEANGPKVWFASEKF